jgi:hypothetical protein
MGKSAPLNHNSAAYLHSNQWEKFSKYLSDMFCDAIAYGINLDTSDLRPSISWQVSLNNGTFVEEGSVHYSVRQASQTSGGVVIDTGKQSAGDPSRNITWLGMRPLK